MLLSFSSSFQSVSSLYVLLIMENLVGYEGSSSEDEEDKAVCNLCESIAQY